LSLPLSSRDRTVETLCRLRCLLREWFPFAWLQAIFVALLLSARSERVLSDYYYALLFIPFLIALGREDWKHLASSWVLRCCLLLLAVSWVATFQSPGLPGSEIVHIGRRALAAFVFVAMTAWLVDRDPGQILRLCYGLAWGAGVTAVISLFVFHWFHWRSQYDLRLTGWVWPNPNEGGAVFGLAAVAAGAAALASLSKGWRATYAAVAILLFACALLTQSRAAMAAAVAAGAICAAAALGRRAVAGLIAAAVVGAVALLVIHASHGGWAGRGDAGRFELWSHFWQQAWQRPLLGYGVPQGLAIKISTGLTTDDPHNMFLWVFLRSGLAGTLCLMTLVALVFRAAIGHGRSSRDFVPLALAIYLLVRGLFESVPPTEGADWFWTYLWLPTGIAAGLELRRRCQASRNPALA
jgi:O-antigen ligase